MDPIPSWTADARRLVLKWIAAGYLDAQHLDAALDAVDGRPPATIWYRDLDRLLLGLGLLLILAGLVVFIAANWEGIGRVARFAMAEGAVVLGVAVAWWRGLDTRGGKAGVIGAAVAVGPLLALIGQTYQTGADPWQLFAVWLVLIVPWVVIARTPVLVILALVLANTALGLWVGNRPWFRYHDMTLAWLGLVLNGVALIAWEFAATRILWLDVRWACRLPALAALTAATGLALSAVIAHSAATWYELPPLAVVLGVGWYAYRRRRRDLAMLSAGVLAALTVIAAGLGRLLIQNAEFGGFLVTGLIVTGLTAWAAMWLRRVSREVP